jgi:putative tryptophan/tyrosine transport system substrate-binding protein
MFDRRDDRRLRSRCKCCYSTNLVEVYRQVGLYVGGVLKGENPADLPVVQPTKFELVINLRTAKALGIKISDNLLSLVDEVIK